MKPFRAGSTAGMLTACAVGIACCMVSANGALAQKAPEAPAPDPAAEKLASVTLSVDFKDAGFSFVLDTLQQKAGLPIVMSPEVRGRVDDPDLHMTLKLDKVRLGTLLRCGLGPKGLVASPQGNTLLIETLGEFRQRTTRIALHDTADLLVDPGNNPGPVWFDRELDTGEPVSGDDLAGLIRENVAPESWSGDGDPSIEFRSGYLAVRNTPDVLSEVDGLLRDVRRAVERRVRVDVVVMRYTPGEALAGFDQNAPLDAAAATALINRARSAQKITAEWSLTCAAGRRNHATAQSTRRFVRGIDAVVASHMSSPDPVVETDWQGFSCDVVPWVSLDGSKVRLTAMLALRTFAEPWPTATLDGRTIDLPRVDAKLFAGTFVTPNDGWTWTALGRSPGGVSTGEQGVALWRTRVESAPAAAPSAPRAGPAAADLARVRERLGKLTIKADFRDLPLLDVIAFLTMNGAGNLLVHDRLRQEVVDRDLRFSLQAEQTTALAVLDLLQQMHGLRIEALDDVAMLLPAQAHLVRPATVLYKVDDFLAAANDLPLRLPFEDQSRPVNRVALGGGLTTGATFLNEEENAIPRMSDDELLEQAKAQFPPSFWESDDMRIGILGGWLVARLDTAAHARLADFLATLSPFESATLTVDAALLEAPRAALGEALSAAGGKAAALDAAQWKAVRDAVAGGKGALLEMLTVVGVSGQRVSTETRHEAAEMTDVDVQIADTASIYNPVIETIVSGWQLETLLFRAEGRIHVDLKGGWARQLPSDAKEWPGPIAITLPCVEQAPVKLSADVTPGQTCVWPVATPGTPAGETVRVLVLRVRP